MDQSETIQLIMEKYKVSLNVASELYLTYRKKDKLKELYFLLHDLDLDKQQEETYE